MWGTMHSPRLRFAGHPDGIQRKALPIAADSDPRGNLVPGTACVNVDVRAWHLLKQTACTTISH